MNEELRTRLIEVALTKDKFLPYGDTAQILHIETDRLDHSRELADELDEISTYEHNQGRPLLSVLVVHQEYLRPGGGFFKMAKRVEKQRTTEDDDAFHMDELRRVRDYWQSHKRYLVIREDGMTKNHEYQESDRLLTELGIKRHELQRCKPDGGKTKIEMVPGNAWGSREEAQKFADELSKRTRKKWVVKPIVEWDNEIPPRHV
jgi:hypothetical protein